jgi:propionate CoA-transferase
MNGKGAVSPVIADIRSRMKRGKIVSVDEAMRVIRDGDTVSIDGFIGGLAPEELLIGLERRFLETGEPKNLTLIFAAGIGDSKDKGINHLAHEGLLQRVIAGHWGLVPKLQRLALDGKIEADNFPQGVISHLYRDNRRARSANHHPCGFGNLCRSPRPRRESQFHHKRRFGRIDYL